MNSLMIEDRFKKAIAFRNKGELEVSVNLFEEIIDMYPKHPKIGGVYTVLGGVFGNLNNHSKAMDCFKSATEFKPDSELASLGLYLSLIELEKYKEAISELKRYLDKYSADRYKVTLEELLNDLEVGYANTYKDTIVELAKKHNVSLPRQ